MGLKNVSVNELECDISGYLEKVIKDDDFLKISTTYGNAVIISEAEWNILVDGMKLVLQ